MTTTVLQFVILLSINIIMLTKANEDRLGDDEDVWDEAIASLPIRHLRSLEHGPLPKNRNEFDPEPEVNSKNLL